MYRYRRIFIYHTSPNISTGETQSKQAKACHHLTNQQRLMMINRNYTFTPKEIQILYHLYYYYYYRKLAET